VFRNIDAERSDTEESPKRNNITNKDYIIIFETVFHVSGFEGRVLNIGNRRGVVY
jgi:hypothetical protein